MRAAVLTGHGGAEVVAYREDMPVPEPGAGQARVAIRAAALNRLDLVREGRLARLGAELPACDLRGWRGRGGCGRRGSDRFRAGRSGLHRPDHRAAE